jgi:hypothetical protein
MSIVNHAGFNFPTDPAFGFINSSNFGGPGFNTGRSSPFCLNFSNTGFGSQIIGLPMTGQRGNCIGYAYRPTGSLGQVNQILTVDNVVGSVVTTIFKIVTRLDHQLDFYAGPSLTKFTSAATFPIGVFKYIEVQFDVSGDTKVYVNDVLDVDTAVTNSISKPPTNMSWAWSNFGSQGYDLDDIYISSGAGAASIERLGPIRITSFYMASDVISGWGRVGASSNSAAVADRHGVTTDAPDGDTSFIQTAFPNIPDLYRVAPMNDCKGRILAVAINAVVKVPSVVTQTLNMIVRPDLTNATNYSVDPVVNALTSSYVLYRAYAPTNPRTGTFWTDGEVEKAGWGMVSGGAGPVRCSMFWIDKIQSLRTVPFSCGQLGSYVYSR